VKDGAAAGSVGGVEPVNPNARQDPRTPLHERVPPTSVASPAQVRPAAGEEVRWYMPSWGETARLLGWRWVLFLPAALLVGLLVMVPMRPWLLQLVFGWWKLWVLVVAVPTVAAFNAASHAIRSRKDPFCIHCGYGLTGLPPEHNCPECGSAYTPELIAEYRRDPRWFIQRHRAGRELPRRDAPFAAGPATKRPRSRDGT
jgi:hypothetical protein